MEKLLLRPIEVCQLIGLGKSKVYELIAAGVLPSVRIQGSVRVPAEGLRKWIEELQSNRRPKNGLKTREYALFELLLNEKCTVYELVSHWPSGQNAEHDGSCDPRLSARRADHIANPQRLSLYLKR